MPSSSKLTHMNTSVYYFFLTYEALSVFVFLLSGVLPIYCDFQFCAFMDFV